MKQPRVGLTRANVIRDQEGVTAAALATTRVTVRDP
jgi:hypothetical protein